MSIYFFYFFISYYYFVICPKKDTIRVKVVLIAISFPSKTSTRTFQKILKSAIELHVVKPEKLGKLKRLICHNGILRCFGWNQLPGKKIIFLSDAIKKKSFRNFQVTTWQLLSCKRKACSLFYGKAYCVIKTVSGNSENCLFEFNFTFMVNTYLHFREWWSYLDNI